MPAISALPSASTLTGTELLALVQGGVTSKATLSAVNNVAVIPSGPYTVTSKEVIGGQMYLDVGATAAAEASANYKRGWQLTIVLSPPDANYDGTWRYDGVTGNRIRFQERAGGGSTQPLTATGGTVTLARTIATTQYVPSKYGAGVQIAGTCLQWDTSSVTSENDDTGMNLADLYIRPSLTTRTALHVGRTTTGADDGYPVVFGKRATSSWQWLNDGHTVRRWSNGGNSNFENSYTINRHGFYTIGYASRGVYANGAAYLAANLSLNGAALGYGMPADGVFAISGGTTGNDLDFTKPASFAVVPREPTALSSGSTNDYSPGVGFSQWWTANGAGSTVTGMVAGVSGEVRYVQVLGGTLTISNESASSTAANRFTCNTGANIAAAVGSLLRMVYRQSTSRWFVTQLA